MCLCSANTVGQLASKLNGKKCMNVAVILWALFAVQVALEVVARIIGGNQPSWLGTALEGYIISGNFGSAGAIIALSAFIPVIIAAVYRTHILMKARKTIETKEGLTPETPLNACCCVFWCFPCVQIQMFHQLGYGAGQEKPYPGVCDNTEFVGVPV